MDFKRPHKVICPPKIPNPCEFSLNPSNINTIFSLIPAVFGSRHLSSHLENTTKLCSSCLMNGQVIGHCRLLHQLRWQWCANKNINSICCQNVSLAQESACPLHRDMNPWGVCWGKCWSICNAKGSQIFMKYTQVPASSAWHKKITIISKCCSTSANQIHRKN